RDPHGTLSAPLIGNRMRPALQILDAPFTGVKCLRPQASGLIQRHAQIIAKRGAGTPLHAILPVPDHPFSSNISGLGKPLFAAGSGACLQAALDSGTLLRKRGDTEYEYQDEK